MTDATKNLRAFKAEAVPTIADCQKRAFMLRDVTIADLDALAARVEKLEDRQGVDRTRTDARGSVTPEASKATGSRKSGPDPEGSQPSPAAPSAVPAPRKFRVGDIITTKFSNGPQTVERVDSDGRLIYTRNGDAHKTWTMEKDATLVRAADAPEAPAEGWKARAEKAEAELDEMRRSKDNLIAERDVLYNATQRQGIEIGSLRAELDALKAKPRFRTRRITLDDASELIRTGNQRNVRGVPELGLKLLRDLGFRRRVDGAK